MFRKPLCSRQHYLLVDSVVLFTRHDLFQKWLVLIEPISVHCIEYKRYFLSLSLHKLMKFLVDVNQTGSNWSGHVRTSPTPPTPVGFVNDS
jgi:hypothetical protein